MLSGRRPTSLVLICMLLLAIAIYHWAFRSGSERLREAAGHELDLLATAINGEITRDASIPAPSLPTPTSWHCSGAAARNSICTNWPPIASCSN